MIEIQKTDIFEKWFRKIKDGKTRHLINIYISRLSQGNFGDSKPIGKGLSELRINYEKGFRLYYKNKNNIIIILLCGGDKSTQKEDILIDHKIAQEENL
jgi:putative addiction module killer protein